MPEIFSYIDPETFQSVWFWIMLSVSWSIVCVRTLNVPYDMLVRGVNGETRALRDVDTLVEISVRRTCGFYAKSGALTIGIMFFLLATSGTFAFVYGYQVAQGIFIFLFPMMIVFFMGVRLCFQIEREGVEGQALCRKLLRRRFWNQIIGITTVAAAMVMMIINIAIKTVFWI